MRRFLRPAVALLAAVGITVGAAACHTNSALVLCRDAIDGTGHIHDTIEYAYHTPGLTDHVSCGFNHYEFILGWWADTGQNHSATVRPSDHWVNWTG